MMTVKLVRQQKGLEPYKSYIHVNDDPRLTLTYFTAGSNLVPKVFEKLAVFKGQFYMYSIFEVFIVEWDYNL